MDAYDELSPWLAFVADRGGALVRPLHVVNYNEGPIEATPQAIHSSDVSLRDRTMNSTIAMLVAVGITAVFEFDSHGAASDRRIDSLMANMSLEEKLGQLQQIGLDPTTGQPRKSTLDMVRHGRIGSLFGVLGVKNTNEFQRVAVEQSKSRIPILFAFDVIHGYRTIFPAPLAEASSWDTAVAERSTRIAASEASAAGVRWVFAPMLAVTRDPRWGRIVEGFRRRPLSGIGDGQGTCAWVPGGENWLCGACRGLCQALGRRRRSGSGARVQLGRCLRAGSSRTLLSAVPARPLMPASQPL